MRLTISIQPTKTKGGAAMMCQPLRLTASGLTPSEAKSKLQKGIVAWCNALARAGQLEDALQRAGLQPEGDGAESLSVTMIEAVQKG